MNPELNRNIVKASGWKVISKDGVCYYITPQGEERLARDPMGNAVFVEELAWGYITKPYDDFLDDVADELPEDFSFTITWEFGDYYCEIFNEDNGRSGGWMGTGDTRAAALAEAYLSYLENKDRKRGFWDIP